MVLQQKRFVDHGMEGMEKEFRDPNGMRHEKVVDKLFIRNKLMLLKCKDTNWEQGSQQDRKSFDSSGSGQAWDLEL